MGLFRPWTVGPYGDIIMNAESIIGAYPTEKADRPGEASEYLSRSLSAIERQSGRWDRRRDENASDGNVRSAGQAGRSRRLSRQTVAKISVSPQWPDLKLKRERITLNAFPSAIILCVSDVRLHPGYTHSTSDDDYTFLDNAVARLAQHSFNDDVVAQVSSEYVAVIERLAAVKRHRARSLLISEYESAVRTKFSLLDRAGPKCGRLGRAVMVRSHRHQSPGLWSRCFTVGRRQTEA